MDINKKSRAELKAYFVKNAIPTEGNFRDFIDAGINQKDDGLAKSAGSPLCIEAASTGERPAIQIYDNFATAQAPSWVWSLLAGTTSGTKTVGFGLGLGDGVGSANSRLFIETGTGNVAIGAVDPAGYKLSVTGTMNVSGAISSGGGLTIAAGQSLTANGMINANAGLTIAANQPLNANGMVNANAGLTIAANQLLNANGMVNANAGLTIPANQPLNANGLLTASAGISVTSGMLKVTGGNWDVGATEGDLRIGNDTLRLKIGIALGGNGAGDVRIRAQGGSNRLFLGGGTTDVLTVSPTGLDVASDIRMPSGTLNFGNTIRQMITLWNPDYGIGIQNSTQYFRTAKNFAWFKGAAGTGELDAGGGTLQMCINDGNVGIGTTPGSYRLNVAGASNLQGDVFVSGPDLLLDNSDRRGGRGGSFRRALTHDGSDCLTLNYGGDYSAGVQISGQLTMGGRSWLMDNHIHLRGVGDENHGVGYFGPDRPFAGASLDGPGLYGCSGGILGTIRCPEPGVEASLALAGGGGYVTLPSMNDDFTGGISIEAWVRFDAFNSWSRIIDWGNGSPSENILFANAGTSGDLSFQVMQGTTPSVLNATGALQTGVWLHLCATIDAAGNGKIYKNGQQIASGHMALPNKVARNNNYIGKSNWPDDWFKGRVAHLRVFTRALGADEIGDHYYNNRPLNSAGLVGWWPLDDGVNKSARDKSGKGRTGTLSATNASFESYQNPALTWDYNNNVTVGNKLQSGNAKQSVSKTDQQQTTSGSWVDLDGMTLTVTTGNNSNLLILFDVNAVQNNAAQTRAYFQILFDGIQLNQSADEFNNTGWLLRNISLHALRTGVSAGAHTIKVQWFTAGGTLTACWAPYGGHRTLSVVEL